MALESFDPAVQFVSIGDDRVSIEYMRDLLQIGSEYPLQTIEVPNKRQNLLAIVFASCRIEPRQSGGDSRYERFASDIANVQNEITRWINDHGDGISSLRSRGVKIKLICNLWLDVNQLDLTLTTELMAGCGNNGIELYLLSNE